MCTLILVPQLVQPARRGHAQMGDRGKRLALARTVPEYKHISVFLYSLHSAIVWIDQPQCSIARRAISSIDRPRVKLLTIDDVFTRPACVCKAKVNRVGGLVDNSDFTRARVRIRHNESRPSPYVKQLQGPPDNTTSRPSRGVWRRGSAAELVNTSSGRFRKKSSKSTRSSGPRIAAHRQNLLSKYERVTDLCRANISEPLKTFNKRTRHRQPDLLYLGVRRVDCSELIRPLLLMLSLNGVLPANRSVKQFSSLPR